MKLFGRKASSVRGADRQVALAVPTAQSVSSIDVAHALASWSGLPPTAPLPGSLALTGPRAAAEGEPEDCWIFALSWTGGAAAPADLSPTEDGLLAAFDLLDSVVSRRADARDVTTGAGAYAAAAFTGLARRTDGQVQLPGEPFAPPAPLEATWSVYVTERPEAEAVLAVLAPSMPGLVRVDDVAASWILEADDGRSVWVSDAGTAEDEAGEPGHRPLCAVAALGATQLYAVRIEGADDAASDADRAELAPLAHDLAAALGGVAADADGYPV